MQIAQRRERHANGILTPGQALIVWVVLAIIAADTVAILVVLGMMNVWEAAVAVFTVLTVAAGAIWTLLLIPHKPSPQKEESGSSEVSPEGMPLNK
jgi:membrane protein YdbS with pleckstrin-like domain